MHIYVYIYIYIFICVGLWCPVKYRQLQAIVLLNTKHLKSTGNFSFKTIFCVVVLVAVCEFVCICAWMCEMSRGNCGTLTRSKYSVLVMVPQFPLDISHIHAQIPTNSHTATKTTTQKISKIQFLKFC